MTSSGYDTGPQMPPLTPKRKAASPPRAKTSDRDYGTRHQKLRKQLLAAFPVCQLQLEGCTGWSQEADHIRRPALSIEDYRAVCRHCHRLRHQGGQ